MVYCRSYFRVIRKYCDFFLRTFNTEHSDSDCRNKTVQNHQKTYSKKSHKSIGRSHSNADDCTNCRCYANKAKYDRSNNPIKF